jgi:hypothetical protein
MIFLKLAVKAGKTRGRHSEKEGREGGGGEWGEEKAKQKVDCFITNSNKIHREAIIIPNTQ